MAASLPQIRREPARAPLRRRPKQLTADPTVFEATGGAGGMVLVPMDGRAAVRRRGRTDRGATVITSEDAQLVTADQSAEFDGEAYAAAQEIAARLWVRRPRPDLKAHRGIGVMRSVPYTFGADDIDLDRTLERLREGPVLADEEIIVRERIDARRSVVLAVDVSGSMRDERIRTAAATVAALAAELPVGDLAVLAFWSDAAWLAHFDVAVDPIRLLSMLVAMPTKGLTNVALPLDLAPLELASRPPKNSRVILLSDCVHNAGPDPRPVAARLARLDVLLDNAGEKDVDLGRELARAGRGLIRAVHTYRDVAGALNGIFSR